MRLNVYPIQDSSDTVCSKDRTIHDHVGICPSPFASNLALIFFGSHGSHNRETIHSLKCSVARKTGIPPERQRYYGVSSCLKGGYRFNTHEILCNDGRLMEQLRGLRFMNHIKRTQTVGVVFLPEDEDEGDDDDEQQPRIVREVDTVAERIAAGRATAIEIGDDSGSEDGDDDDSDEEQDAGAPRPKRQRRDEDESDGSEEEDSDEEDEEEDSDEEDEEEDSDEEDGVATAVAAAIVADDRDVADGEDEENEERDEAAAEAEDHDDPEQQAEGAEDEENADNAVAEQAGGVEEEANDVAVNVVAEAAAEAGAAAVRDPAPSPLRQWLRALDATGSNTGRFERYAPALELEFDSLADLALVPAEAPSGWEDLFEVCGVGRLGDRLRLKRAIRSLPPPPE